MGKKTYSIVGLLFRSPTGKHQYLHNVLLCVISFYQCGGELEGGGRGGGGIGGRWKVEGVKIDGWQADGGRSAPGDARVWF